MSMMVAPHWFGAGGGGGVSPQEFTVTVASGTVASNLTNFPVMVRLSDMPAGFWDNVRSDGGDVRVTTTADVTVPHDLIRFDYDDQDGVLFFKAASVLAASANNWKITCGTASLEKLGFTDTNGRNAVWSDYARVLFFGETLDDRTGNGIPSNTLLGGDPDQFAVVETETLSTTDLAQGICSDGSYYYISYTTGGGAQTLEKRDLSWNIVATNSDPLGDTGDASINHVGDIDCHGGLIYAALQNWNGTTESQERIGVWNASDLSFVTMFDISAQHPGASGVTYCAKDNLLYVCSFTDDDKLWKYDPSDGSYIGALTLTYAAVVSSLQLQGVHWWRDAFWLNSDFFDETFRSTYSGSVSTSGLFGNDVSAGGGEYEGIGSVGDCLVVVQKRSGPVFEAKRWKPLDLAKAAGGGVKPNASTDTVKASGITPLTTYTIGATIAFSSTTGANRTPLSYWNSALDNARQSIAFRNSNSTLAIWDVNNSWLEASPALNPTLNQSYRVNVSYQGTTARKLYVDGAQKASQSSITALPSTLNTLNLLREDDTAAEPFSGKLGFVYLRSGVLSADWIAAEHSNLNAPSAFYSIT